MKHLIQMGLILCLAEAALGDVVISEWMYSGADGEFIEFTNTGPDAVDMTGWSYDDDSRTPGSVDLSAFGLVTAGESVLLTEAEAADFAAAWALSDVTIIGGNQVNLGRADEINLYDAGGNLVDRLSYGDETYAGTIRTQTASGNIPLADYDKTVVQSSWTLAAVSDAFGSQASAQGDLGSPGTAPVSEDTDEAATTVIGQLCGLGVVESVMAIAVGLTLLACTSRRSRCN